MGAGQASAALSELTDKKVEVEYPTIQELDAREIPDEIGYRTDKYATILVNVEVKEGSEKDRLGKLLLVLDKDSAKRFSEYLENEIYDTDEDETIELTAHDESAMKETGNILTGACLAAMTGWVDLQLKEGIPSIETDMLSATLDHVLAEMSQDLEKVLFFRTEFNFEHKISASFLFIFEPEGEREILDKLEV